MGKKNTRISYTTFALGIRILLASHIGRTVPMRGDGLDHMGHAGDVRRARIIIDFWGAPRVRGDTNTDNWDTIAIRRASPDLGLGIGYTFGS